MFEFSPETIEAITRFIYSILLLILILILAHWQKLRLTVDIVLSAIRGFVQLLIFAAIILVIFILDELLPLLIILLIMTLFGSSTISNRLKELPKSFSLLFLTLTISVFSVMSIAIMFSIIPLTGEFFIPIGGMVVGNAMNMSYLTINKTLADIKNRKNQIESALALGIRPLTILTDFEIKSESIQNGIIPTINNLKTLGLVVIPGLMSGMIIGGISPIDAAFYQVIIFFLVLLAGLLASIISSYLVINKIFDKTSESITINFE
jgi:putative ABC transport system permease protein